MVRRGSESERYNASNTSNTCTARNSTANAFYAGMDKQSSSTDNGHILNEELLGWTYSEAIRFDDVDRYRLMLRRAERLLRTYTHASFLRSNGHESSESATDSEASDDEYGYNTTDLERSAKGFLHDESDDETYAHVDTADSLDPSRGAAQRVPTRLALPNHFKQAVRALQFEKWALGMVSDSDPMKPSLPSVETRLVEFFCGRILLLRRQSLKNEATRDWPTNVSDFMTSMSNMRLLARQDCMDDVDEPSALQRCDLCNRHEHTCNHVLDVAAPVLPTRNSQRRKALHSIDALVRWYTDDFIAEYSQAVDGKTPTDESGHPKYKVHPLDKGSISCGMTCIRAATVCFSLTNDVVESIYNMHLSVDALNNLKHLQLDRQAVEGQIRELIDRTACQLKEREERCSEQIVSRAHNLDDIIQPAHDKHFWLEVDAWRAEHNLSLDDRRHWFLHLATKSKDVPANNAKRNDSTRASSSATTSQPLASGERVAHTRWSCSNRSKDNRRRDRAAPSKRTIGARQVRMSSAATSRQPRQKERLQRTRASSRQARAAARRDDTGDECDSDESDDSWIVSDNDDCLEKSESEHSESEEPSDDQQTASRVRPSRKATQRVSKKRRMVVPEHQDDDSIVTAGEQPRVAQSALSTSSAADARNEHNTETVSETVRQEQDTQAGAQTLVETTDQCDALPYMKHIEGVYTTCDSSFMEDINHATDFLFALIVSREHLKQADIVLARQSIQRISVSMCILKHHGDPIALHLNVDSIAKCANLETHTGATPTAVEGLAQLQRLQLSLVDGTQ